MGGVCSSSTKPTKVPKKAPDPRDSANSQSFQSPSQKNQSKSDPKPAIHSEPEKTITNNTYPAYQNQVLTNEAPLKASKQERMLPPNPNPMPITQINNLLEMRNGFDQGSAVLLNQGMQDLFLNQRNDIINQGESEMEINKIFNMRNSTPVQSSTINEKKTAEIKAKANMLVNQESNKLKNDKSSELLDIFNKPQKDALNSILNVRSGEGKSERKDFKMIKTQEMNLNGDTSQKKPIQDSNKIQNILLSDNGIRKLEEIDANFNIHSSNNFKIEISQDFFVSNGEKPEGDNNVLISFVQKFDATPKQTTGNNPALDAIFEPETKFKTSTHVLEAERKIKKEDVLSSTLPKPVDYFETKHQKSKSGFNSAGVINKESPNIVKENMEKGNMDQEKANIDKEKGNIEKDKDNIENDKEMENSKNIEDFKSRTRDSLKSDLCPGSPIKPPKDFPLFQKSTFIKNQTKHESKKSGDGVSNFFKLQEIINNEGGDGKSPQTSKFQQISVFTEHVEKTNYIQPKQVEISEYRDENMSSFSKMKMENKPFDSSDERSNNNLSIEQMMNNKKRGSNLAISSGIFNISFSKKIKEPEIIVERNSNLDEVKDLSALLEQGINEFEEFSDFSEEISRLSNNINVMGRTFSSKPKKNEASLTTNRSQGSTDKKNSFSEGKMQSKAAVQEKIEESSFEQHSSINVLKEEDEEEKVNLSNPFKLSSNWSGLNEEYQMFDVKGKEKNKDSENMTNLNLQKTSVRGRNIVELDGVFISQKK